MSERSVRFWLEQIVFFGMRLEAHIGDMSETDFLRDDRTIDAACWCIACIGEACGKILEIDPDFEKRHKSLPLRAAYAARNRYVHGYFDLDAGQMWSTATVSVPALVSAVRVLLNDQG